VAADPNVAPDALRHDPNGPIHTVESLTAERQKLKETKEKEAQRLAAPPTPSIAATDALSTAATDGTAPPLGSETPSSDPNALADEADQQGAFNPETGEINWDCPCLGGMAHGPCGENFRAAFSCFVYSKEEPKGVDCIDKFK
jgi:mitochondrial intermembrane space import and assembly protein 40